MKRTLRKCSLRSHLLELYFYKKYTVKKFWTASAFIILIALSVSDASGLAVKSKNVDAGAIYDIGYNRLIESGAATTDDLIVIWESDPIPKSPIAVRGDLDSTLKMKIQQAFIDMPVKDPEAMKTFESKWEKNEQYVAINDSTYEYLREIGASLGYI